MHNPFIPIILLILSGASYFAFIAPFWDDIGVVQVRQESARETIKQGEELKTLAADIAAKVKQFEERDPNGRLGAILPLEIDEILFLNDLSALVGNQGLEAKELTLSGSDDEGSTGGAGQAQNDPDSPGSAQNDSNASRDRTYRTVSFSVSATYPQFVALLREIEQNLVLLEIESVEFTAGAAPEVSGARARSTSTPVADYSITLRTVSVR